jgi:hypothetical protein
MTKLLIVFFALFSAALYGQERVREQCGEVFTETSQQKPVFGDSKDEITSYFTENILFKSENQFRGIFQVKMNCKGEIFLSNMIKGNLSEDVVTEIQAALLKMPKWKPANLNGPVDYVFFMDFLFKGEKLRVNTLMR